MDPRTFAFVESIMALELLHVTVGLTFLGIVAFVGDILIRPVD